jgi:hypothetical protein
MHNVWRDKYIFNGVFYLRARDKEERKIRVLINEYGPKLDQIHSLESLFFPLLNFFFLNQAHPIWYNGKIVVRKKIMKIDE